MSERGEWRASVWKSRTVKSGRKFVWAVVTGALAAALGAFIYAFVSSFSLAEDDRQDSERASEEVGTYRGDVRALKEVASGDYSLLDGSVNGSPVYGVPSVMLNGVQCSGNAASFVLNPDQAWERLDFIAGIDDRSPPDSRVNIRVLQKDQLLVDEIVMARTNGLNMEALLEGVAEVRVESRALSRTPDCDASRIRVIFNEGIVR